MGFSIKSFEEIRQDMIDKLTSLSSEITDFNVGSNIRNIIATIAAEIEETYYQLQMAYLNALPLTATSTNLDTVLGGWGVNRSGACKASGIIKFERLTAATDYVVVPQGTEAATTSSPYQDAISFITDADIVIDIGATAGSGYATAVEAGADGNVDEGKITTIVSTVTEIDSCTNDYVFTGGIDAEDDSAYRSRFIEFIYGQARGTPDSIENGAKTVTGIIATKLYENDPSAGACKLYVAISGGQPSASLVTQVQSVIDGYYRPAGVTVTVIGATNLLVNISATITMDTGLNAYDLRETCEAELYAYLATKTMGEDVLQAEVIKVLMDVTGVINVTNLLLNSVDADLEVDPTEVAKAGAFTLTVS